MSEIDNTMCEDGGVSIAAQATDEREEREWDEKNRRIAQQEFFERLRDRMLENPLIEEIDIGALAQEEKFVLSNQEESTMTEAELNDVEQGKKDWSVEYDRCIENPPKEGDILSTLPADGMVVLVVELKSGAPPFIYARAYVPDIVGEALGWFLHSPESTNFHGWKCILLPRARTELIRRFGLKSETMLVKSLRVIRPSQSGKSLLCEVHCYGDEKEEVVQETQPAQEEPQDEVDELGSPSPDDVQTPEITAGELQ